MSTKREHKNLVSVSKYTTKCGACKLYNHKENMILSSIFSNKNPGTFWATRNDCYNVLKDMILPNTKNAVKAD